MNKTILEYDLNHSYTTNIIEWVMKYSGMTVNERLETSGLIKAFDNAIKRKRFEKAVEILIKTELTPEQARLTVGTIKENLKKYGY